MDNEQEGETKTFIFFFSFSFPPLPSPPALFTSMSEPENQCFGELEKLESLNATYMFVMLSKKLYKSRSNSFHYMECVDGAGKLHIESCFWHQGKLCA